MNSGAAKPQPATLSHSTIHIDDLLQNGQGVGRADGLVVFVTGALPGEDASIAVDAVKKKYVSAHARSIVKPSPDRVDSVCPVFPRCGGCQTLHYAYAAQLRWKQQIIAEALARVAGLPDVRVNPSIAGELLEGARYRNKVSLVARLRGGDAALGFYAARSHDLVPISHCPVLLPWLDEAVRSFIELAGQTPQLLRDVQHVVVRTGLSRRTLVVVVCTSRERPELAGFVDRLRKSIAGLSGFVASWNPATPNAVFGRQFETLWGSPETIEVVAKTAFRFGPASFFQINTSVLGLIANDLLEKLKDCRRVVDLYSGVGTFAVLLGKRGIPVTGVESYGPAVDEAATNAARNGVTSVAFEHADASAAVSGDRGRTLLQGADAVILDPPRRGCEPEVLEGLVRTRVPNVEYLSCNPATLARDARHLVDGGYELREVTPFDMFPFTGHVEALAEFQLR